MRLRSVIVALLLLPIAMSVAVAQDSPIDDAALDAALTGPLPDPDGSILEPSVLRYTATVTAGQREMQLNVRRTVEQATLDGKRVWRMVEGMVTEFNSAVDTFEMDLSTLQPQRRSAGGSGTTIRLRYDDDRVRGTLRTPGRRQEIDALLEHPVFADGAGLELVIASLPLVEGYEETLRTFDPQAAESRPMQLSVTGTERVSTGAGTYDAFVVEVTPLDGSDAGAATLYLMPDAPHYLVKGTYQLPAEMGGNQMTLELVNHE